DQNVECEPSFGIGILPNKKIGQRLARFRQINMDNAVTHPDALEFPDGQVVLVTRLCEGQCATVSQLPAGVRPETSEKAEPETREVSVSLSSTAWGWLTLSRPQGPAVSDRPRWGRFRVHPISAPCQSRLPAERQSPQCQSGALLVSARTRARDEC